MEQEREDEIFEFEAEHRCVGERFQLPRGRLMADGKERLIKRSGWPYHDIKHFRGGQERWTIIKVYTRGLNTVLNNRQIWHVDIQSFGQANGIDINFAIIDFAQSN